MRPLQSVTELEDKPTVCREEDQEFTRELQEFEEEYDDLCESTDILKNCWERNGEMLKKNRPFGRELRTLKADVAELKQEYEDCIKLDQTRYLSFIKFASFIAMVLSEYGLIRGSLKLPMQFIHGF